MQKIYKISCKDNKTTTCEKGTNQTWNKSIANMKRILNVALKKKQCFSLFCLCVRNNSIYFPIYMYINYNSIQFIYNL